MPSAKIYYDADADLSVLDGKIIVFLGFGNQGAAQAQNLRDSGIPNERILIANRPDAYAEDAKSKGFIVEHDFGKAAQVADVIFLLIPDQVQPRVFNGEVAPVLKDTAAIVIASGYNVYYKLLNFKPTQDVVMVAPRMIGSSVRSLYVKGRGFPCFVSAEQDGTGKGLTIAVALSRVVGATKAGAIASSAREETAMDLFAEQALWPNIIVLFREAFSVLKEAGCSDEALCYEMWMSKEPAEIFERAADDGFVGQVCPSPYAWNVPKLILLQLKHHSVVSQFGQLSGALNLTGLLFVPISKISSITGLVFVPPISPARSMLTYVSQVLNGKFCEEFSKIEADLEKEGSANPLNELYRKTNASELVEAEVRVRSRLADLL
ncbi:IlvN-domain-containing protein [Amylocystis lapponica]|nr:IlvN-domain-containing protein [Amylocystis lapponica]